MSKEWGKNLGDVIAESGIGRRFLSFLGWHGTREIKLLFEGHVIDLTIQEEAEIVAQEYCQRFGIKRIEWAQNNIWMGEDFLPKELRFLNDMYMFALYVAKKRSEVHDFQLDIPKHEVPNIQSIEMVGWFDELIQEIKLQPQTKKTELQEKGFSHTLFENKSNYMGIDRSVVYKEYKTGGYKLILKINFDQSRVTQQGIESFLVESTDTYITVTIKDITGHHVTIGPTRVNPEYDRNNSIAVVAQPEFTFFDVDGSILHQVEVTNDGDLIDGNIRGVVYYNR